MDHRLKSGVRKSGVRKNWAQARKLEVNLAGKLICGGALLDKIVELVDGVSKFGLCVM